ncbi:unnamed protein product [Amoebophrya sp. A25]|nr:unnamed protein product [Amoebophrya sp. A25]|eukprot:GSA25T00020210001.1
MKDPRIPVVVCEHHDIALRALHLAVRKKKMEPGVAFLHFDAHPDLATIGDLPASLCRPPTEPSRKRSSSWSLKNRGESELGEGRKRKLPEPGDNEDEEEEEDDLDYDIEEEGEDEEAEFHYDVRDLYDRLRTADGGIASWILPAIYSDLIKTVVWVKQSWSRQIPAGSYHGRVGRDLNTGSLKVDGDFANLSYFDEDSTSTIGSSSTREQKNHKKGLKSLEEDSSMMSICSRGPTGATTSSSSTNSNISQRKSALRFELEEAAASESQRFPAQIDYPDARPWTLAVVEDVGTLPSIMAVEGEQGKRNGTISNVNGCLQSSSSSSGPTVTSTTTSSPWALDIDLDYFTTRNPFVLGMDLRFVTALQLAIEEYEGPDRYFVSQSEWHSKCRDFPYETLWSDALAEENWPRCLEILFAYHEEDPTSTPTHTQKKGEKKNKAPKHSQPWWKDFLLKGYTPGEREMSLLLEAGDMLSLPQWVAGEFARDVEPVVSQVEAALRKIHLTSNSTGIGANTSATSSALSSSREASSSTSQKHFPGSFSSTTSPSAVTESKSKALFQGAPASITIARSCADNFLPMRVACELEQRILEMLRSVYGDLEITYADEIENCK